MIDNHDKGANRVEVDPLALAFSGLETDVVAELEHHVLGAAHCLEPPCKFSHVDDALALRGPRDQGDDGGAVGVYRLRSVNDPKGEEMRGRTVAGAPQHLLMIAESDIGFMSSTVSLLHDVRIP